jgi:hypothetical protein
MSAKTLDHGAWTRRRMTAAKKHKSRGYQLVPKNPTHRMLKKLAGDPLILCASDEEELRKRYEAMLEASPVK